MKTTPTEPQPDKQPKPTPAHWLEESLSQHLHDFPGAEPRIKAAMTQHWLQTVVFFDKKAVRNQNFDRRLKIIAIAGGLVSTALGPALASDAPTWLGWVVSAAGIAVTAVTQIADTFKPAQLHESARRSCELITSEIWGLLFGIDAYSGLETKAAIALCAERVEAINRDNMTFQFAAAKETGDSKEEELREWLETNPIAQRPTVTARESMPPADFIDSAGEVLHGVEPELPQESPIESVPTEDLDKDWNTGNFP